MTKIEREKLHQREVAVSRLKLVLIVVCLIAIPVSWFSSHVEIGGVSGRITKIEGPCQRYGPDSKICERAFEEAAASINHRMACFFQHRAGVHPPSCRGVHLRIKPPGRSPGSRSSKGGGAIQQPSSTAHQQPSPHHGGSGHQGQGGTRRPPKTHKPPHHAKASPAPVATQPVPPPAETTPPPQPGNSGETPAAEHSQGIKACVDLVVSACVKSEAEVPLQSP